MTVQELIKKLSAYPKNAKVKVYAFDTDQIQGYYSESFEIDIEDWTGGEIVYLG